MEGRGHGEGLVPLERSANTKEQHEADRISIAEKRWKCSQEKQW